MLTLDNDTHEQIIALIVPHVTDMNARQALLLRAFSDKRLLGSIDYSGNARDFTVLLIDRLITYGKIDGEEALWRLLTTIRDGGYYGSREQAEIDNLRSTFFPTEQKSRPTPPVLPLRSEETPVDVAPKVSSPPPAVARLSRQEPTPDGILNGRAKLAFATGIIVVILAFVLPRVFPSSDETPPPIVSTSTPMLTMMLTDTPVSPTLITATSASAAPLSPTITTALTAAPPSSSIGTISATLYRDQQSLTLYVSGNRAVSLAGLTFRANNRDYPIESYPSLMGLPFGAMQPPFCLRLVENGANLPIPLACQTSTVFTQQLASADIFWFDPTANLERTIELLQGERSLGFCPAGQAACNFSLPAA
jgi:hypothetical protein